MLKKILFIALTFFLNFGVNAQKDYQDYWKELLNNNRKESRKIFQSKKKNYDKNIVDLISNEVIRNEGGLINGPSEGFLDKLTSFKDYEYYVYALWNKQFLFDNYIETGFHNTNTSNIKKLFSKEVNNTTIKSSLRYINAIMKRSYNDFDGYQSLVSSIPAIKKWQYCGTFENLNGSGIDIAYEPETYTKSDKLFNANSNGLVGWYTPHQKHQIEPYQFFSNHEEYGAGVNYAQTFIKSNKEQTVQLRIANSSAFKLWLNDVLVYKNLNDVNTDFDAYIVNVNLSKGYNRLLVKNAEGNYYSYFSVRVSDEKGNPIENLEYTEKSQTYTKSTKEEVNPIKVVNEIEEFFSAKVAENPNEFLYAYCLMGTYLRNQKFNHAKKVLKPLQARYPNSSLLRIFEASIATYEQDYVKLKEINSNTVNDDPKYYYSLLNKIGDSQYLSRMDIPTLEAFLNDIQIAMPDYPLVKDLSNMMLYSKTSNLSKLKELAKQMIVDHEDKLYMIKRILPLYTQLFKDRGTSITKLESILDKRYSSGLQNILIGYYEKNDEKDKVLSLLENDIKKLPEDNYSISRIVRKMHSYKRYKESLPYIEMMLKNYPYSFKAMKYKGDALTQLKRKKEALEYYNKSLSHNNGNSSLRKTIQNLNKEKSLIEEYKQKDVYEFIKKNRNLYKKNNHGSNILLDESVVQLYENGSLKKRATLIYEITSKNGVENYKEYDLGLSGRYQIIKSEIVKANNSIIPAEKSRSQFVFNGLEIGDVIHIEYETNSNGAGRFYKDFVDFYQFDSESFCHKTAYVLIIPKSFDLNYHVSNGEIPHSKKKLGKYNVHTWELIKADELPKSESYMPTYSDYARSLHISTINSWNEIANWYSDLVRTQLKINDETESKFKEIFPENDLSSLSDEVKAKRIYDYVMNNFTYSYVSFKQSGFIPQKPSKTISSKLGDCKDFSTLYTAFARKAGLTSNLVLVSTSDLGQKNLILPSQDFNHCIVKVNMSGEDYFLELTDKNLPFKSMPNSLVNATALEIPYESSTKKKYDIFKIKNINATKSVSKKIVTVNVGKENLNFNVKSELKGSLASYYFDILSKDKYDEIKEALKKDLAYRTGETIVLDTISNISLDKNTGIASYELKLKMNDKISKVGSMSIFELPIFTHAYNKDIVKEESRKYDIQYSFYEYNDFYDTTYEINLPEGKKFVEVPESKSYTYKKHTFKINFEAINESSLRVKIEAKPDKANITVEEYKAFKSYVENVMKSKEILLGYK